MLTGGLLPFPRTGCVLYATAILSYCSERRQFRAALKLETHSAAVGFHCMHYNFVRIHETLRVTPAVQAGLTNRVWSIEDIIGLLEMAEREPPA